MIWFFNWGSGSSRLKEKGNVEISFGMDSLYRHYINQRRARLILDRSNGNNERLKKRNQHEEDREWRTKRLTI